MKTFSLILLWLFVVAGCGGSEPLSVDDVLVRIQKSGYKMKVIPLQALTVEDEEKISITPERKFTLQLYEEILDYKYDVRFFMFKSEEGAEMMQEKFNGFVVRNWFFAGDFSLDFQNAIKKALSS